MASDLLSNLFSKRKSSTRFSKSRCESMISKTSEVGFFLGLATGLVAINSSLNYQYRIDFIAMVAL